MDPRLRGDDKYKFEVFPFLKTPKLQLRKILFQG